MSGGGLTALSRSGPRGWGMSSWSGLARSLSSWSQSTFELGSCTLDAIVIGRLAGCGTTWIGRSIGGIAFKGFETHCSFLKVVGGEAFAFGATLVDR